MKLSKKTISLLLVASAFMMSCRGQISDKPPIHPNPNMDFQERFNAQQENLFFEDGRAMRMPVEGTIARGNLRQDLAFYEGVDQDGNFIEHNPMELTEALLYRGKERYDIFCSVCHGGVGDGQGIIMTGQYGYVPAPSFHTDELRADPDGEIYSAITNGYSTMPAYASQIKVEDRWAIVAYVRALQRSQYVPEPEMERFDVDLATLHQQYEEEQVRAQALADARAAGADETISAERGEQLFTRYGCQTCHSTDGSRILGPTFQGLFGNERTFDDGSSAVADEEYVRQSITDPRATTVEGYDDVMQPFDYLSDSEIESLIEFIKSLSDN